MPQPRPASGGSALGGGDGGINIIPDPQDASFLTDPVYPTMAMGGDITHPPPGNRGRLSFTSLVGSVDANAMQYASRMSSVSDDREKLQHLFGQYREATGERPERILFYRDVYAQLNFNPTTMLLVVGNGHKFVFSPKASIAEGGQPPLKPNFPQGTVIDTVLTRSVELDFYLCSHQDTRHDKPAQYSVLLDDNNVMCVLCLPLRSMGFNRSRTLSATSPRTAPAPVYYTQNVCARAKNYYNPQAGQELPTAASDVVSTAPSQAASGAGDEGSWVNGNA
ncbi:Ribonuclease H-like domain containing protein [Lactarius tabidus]